MKIDRKRILWIGGTIVAVVTLVLAFRPKPLPVETAPVRRGPLAVTVEARGQTRAVDTFVVTAPVAGNLERLLLRAGDLVRQGQVIARIEPSSLTAVDVRQVRAAVTQAGARVRETAAALGRARAQADLASKQRARIAALHAQGIASSGDLDAARTAETAAERDAQSAQAAVVQANGNLAGASAALLPLTRGSGVIELRAPITARIFQIPERSGRAIASGQEILALGNPHRIEAVIDVLSQDAVKIHDGDSAFLVDWGGDHPLPGVVRTVESSAFTRISALGIEEQRVHVIVTIADPPAQLGHGYRVWGRIVIWQSANVLQIPIGALTRFGQKWGVYVIEGDRARRRDIEVGHRNDQSAEVTAGLKVGERAIVYPGDDVSDGVRVAWESR